MIVPSHTACTGLILQANLAVTVALHQQITNRSPTKHVKAGCVCVGMCGMCEVTHDTDEAMLACPLPSKQGVNEPRTHPQTKQIAPTNRHVHTRRTEEPFHNTPSAQTAAAPRHEYCCAAAAAAVLLRYGRCAAAVTPQCSSLSPSALDCSNTWWWPLLLCCCNHIQQRLPLTTQRALSHRRCC